MNSRALCLYLLIVAAWRRAVSCALAEAVENSSIFPLQTPDPHNTCADITGRKFYYHKLQMSNVCDARTDILDTSSWTGGANWIWEQDLINAPWSGEICAENEYTIGRKPAAGGYYPTYDGSMTNVLESNSAGTIFNGHETDAFGESSQASAVMTLPSKLNGRDDWDCEGIVYQSGKANYKPSDGDTVEYIAKLLQDILGSQRDENVGKNRIPPVPTMGRFVNANGFGTTRGGRWNMPGPLLGLWFNNPWYTIRGFKWNFQIVWDECYLLVRNADSLPGQSPYQYVYPLAYKKNFKLTRTDHGRGNGPPIASLIYENRPFRCDSNSLQECNNVAVFVDFPNACGPDGNYVIVWHFSVAMKEVESECAWYIVENGLLILEATSNRSHLSMPGCIVYAPATFNQLFPQCRDRLR